MRRTAALGAITALALLGGCDGGSGSTFDVAAQGDRLAGNAPLRVAFGARANGPLDAQYDWTWDFGDGETATGESPTHVFEQAGEYRVTVRGAAGGDSGRDTLDVQVSPSADLVVGSVAAEPRRARAGAEIQITWNLHDTAAPVVGDWKIAVFLSADDRLDPEDLILLEQVEQITPPSEPTGMVATARLPADLATGDWKIGVVADPEGAVGDVRRSDNVAFAPFELQIRNPTDTGPDLVICGLTVPAFESLPPDQTPVVQLGDQLPVSVCLGNDGNQPTASASYALFLSRDDLWDEGDLPAGGAEGLALGSGDREQLDAVLDVGLELPVGEWFLLAVADPKDAVEEQQEDNNLRVTSSPFEVVEAGAVTGVDLVVARLTIEGDRGFWGQQLGGELRLINRGDVAVERTFVVRLLAEPVDGRAAVQLPSLNVPGVAAGADLVLPLAVSITRRVAEGDYRLSAVADPTNSVGDVNPGNNRRTLQRVLTLGGEPNLDPAVDSVRFAPRSVEAEAELTVQIDLSNVGRDPTGAFEAAVVLSADDRLDAGDAVLDVFPVDSLAGGADRQIERVVRVPATLDQQVAEWRVGVVVDPSDRLTAERSEENNVLFAVGRLTVSGLSGGCAEDLAFEENDVPAAAQELAPGTYEGLGACDEADWFAVTVPAGQVLDVALSWAAEEGTPTLHMEDVEGAALDEIEQRPGRKTVFLPAAEVERRVLVEVTGGGGRLQYDLSVALTEVGALPNLRLRAVGLTPPFAQAGASVDVRATLWNVGGAAAGASEATVGLASTPEGALEVPLGVMEAGALEAGAALELEGRVTLPAELADGRWYVVVQADSGAAVVEGSEEDNRAVALLRVDAEQACALDALEPNGSHHEGEGFGDQPAPLGAGEVEDLVVCRGDDDWYGVVLAEGERLDAEVGFRHLDGDLDLELYEPDGETLIDRSAGLQDTESVVLLRAPAAGTYFLRVHLAAGDPARSNTYRLSLRVGGADACQDDDFEPNGSSEAASLLPDGRHDLRLCPGDEDWFRFSIPVGNTVSFQVSAGEADVRIALFGPDGALIDEDGRRIVHEARVTGFYRLRARVDAPTPVIYALQVAGVSGVDLELADLRLSAERASAGADLRASVRVANRRGDAADGVVLRFLLSDDARASADDVVLAEQIIERVDGAAEIPLGQRLRVPAETPDGPHFVLAVLDPDRLVADVRPSNNERSTPLQVVSACVDDDARLNEGPATATPLVDSPVAAVICAHTEDWYALDVPDAGRVSIWLSFAQARGDLDLAVYEGDALLADSRTEGDEEAVFLELAAPTTLLIQVDGFLDAEAPYDLSWTLP